MRQNSLAQVFCFANVERQAVFTIENINARPIGQFIQHAGIKLRRQAGAGILLVQGALQIGFAAVNLDFLPKLMDQLCVSQRPVSRIGGQAMAFDQGIKAVPWVFRVKAARQFDGAEHGGSKGDAQPLEFVFQEAVIEACIVRNEQSAGEAAQGFIGHFGKRWRRCDHPVTDTGQLFDKGGNPRTWIDQLLPLTHAPVGIDFNDADFSNPVSGGGGAGGFKVDKGKGTHDRHFLMPGCRLPLIFTLANPMPDFLPEPFAGLAPSTVWRHFATLCAIPRPSKQEHALRAYVQGWAQSLGLSVTVDGVGNLILKKSASSGREKYPGVVLQAHLDMVCQKNSDTPHDFSRDPIRPLLRDGWLLAENTTLGADNGIGVALIMAVLENAALEHGPIEALLTVDEEAGMGGAHGLVTDCLDGRLMLNLDTEVWGEFYLGCAGGLDVNVARNGSAVTLPEAYEGFLLELRGLRGGHSGVDIHEARGNAIKLLVRLLCSLAERWPLRLASLVGGTARNALPREASAQIAVPAGLLSVLNDALEEAQAAYRKELGEADQGLQLLISPCRINQLMAEAEQAIWLASLNAAPHGVRQMSRALPDVVETSNNLGMVDVQVGHGACNFMVRSLQDSGSLTLGQEIVSLFSLSGTQAVCGGHYPGWTPNPGSPLLALCQSVFQRDFAGQSKVQVIHAGLECGIIGAKYPAMDIVSFGPTIHGAHAPGERVEVASVERCWRLLKAILAEIH